MKIASVFRTLALISYLFIFVQGMIILIPFGCILFNAIFEESQNGRIFLLIADLALLALFILSFNKPTRQTILVQAICYFLLLAPLVNVLSLSTSNIFSYPLFIIPTTCFAVLYPLSVYYSWKNLKNGLKDPC